MSEKDQIVTQPQSPEPQSGSQSATPPAAGAPGPAAAPAKASGSNGRTERQFRKAEARVRAVANQAQSAGPVVMSGRTKLGLLLTAALIVVTWWHAFGEMWNRWFPAWSWTAAPLTDRLTEGDSYYTHGPLVPAASLMIAYLIYKRVGLPSCRTRGSSLAGGVLLTFSLLLQIVAARAGVTFASGFALIGVLGGLVLLWGGWGLARAYWLPVAFLFFMVPLPMNLIADLNFELKRIASSAALWVAIHVFGVPAVVEGSQVNLMPDAITGEPKSLMIENVCGGLRSLISLICFASLFALICRVKGLWRLFMLIVAAPVAIMTNVLRITILTLSAHYLNVKVSGPGGWVHDTSGIAVFALALAMMFALEWLIIHLGRLLKRNWTDPRLLGYLDELPKRAGQGLATLRPLPMAGMALVAGMTIFWTFESPHQYMGDVARKAVATSIQLENVTYDSEDGEMDAKTLQILETKDYLYRHFLNPTDPDANVDMTIVFSPNNRKGTHPPEVCLEGSGARIVTKDVEPVDIPPVAGAVGSGLNHLVVRELITEHGGEKVYHAYTYKCGDAYTPSFFKQQLTIFINGLVNRNSAGALIRFDVKIKGDDVTSARKLALDAVKVLMPQVDRGLP